MAVCDFIGTYCIPESQCKTFGLCAWHRVFLFSLSGDTRSSAMPNALPLQHLHFGPAVSCEAREAEWLQQ